MQGMPTVAYTVAQARELDRLASASFGIPEYTLMQRAGQAAATFIHRHFPLAQRIAIVCGPGNNAGDGYVLARLLQAARRDVVVVAEGNTPQEGPALAAFGDWRSAGGALAPFAGHFDEFDLVVDALFGIGLTRALEGQAAAIVAAINAQVAPILALDVPTGLNADSGDACGPAVRATLTLSFIGLKRGMITGAGQELCGEIHVDTLDLPDVLFACVPPALQLLDDALLRKYLPPRERHAYKGHFGHVLVVGGDEGMGGAVRLAAEGALRSGAGLVSVATRPVHVAPILASRPEIMVRGISGPAELDALLDRATVVIVGPGLGRGTWSQLLLAAVTERNLPTIMDADALNGLAESACVLPEHVVLTPHPGEAARLLECSSADVQRQRFESADKLAEFFSSTVVLKGAGTIVRDKLGTSVCPIATPALATGGSGDVLAGVIGGLMAQGLPTGAAARCAVHLHALAGAAAGADGERGTVAGDLMLHIKRLVNPR